MFCLLFKDILLSLSTYSNETPKNKQNVNFATLHVKEIFDNITVDSFYLDYPLSISNRKLGTLDIYIAT